MEVISDSRFVESSELISRLSLEITRLKDERKGTSLTLNSITEENAILVEKLGEFKKRTVELVSRVDCLLSSHSDIEEERRRCKMQVDLSSLRQIEADARFHIMQDQYAEMTSRENKLVQELERTKKENVALKSYITKLEVIAEELHREKQSEIAAKRRLEVLLLATKRDMDLSKQLALLQEEQEKPLALKIVKLTKKLHNSKKKISQLLSALRKYESICQQEQIGIS